MRAPRERASPLRSTRRVGGSSPKPSAWPRQSRAPEVPRQPDAPGMHGVLVVAKPAGPTSHDVVALVRRLAGTRRIGHGGTLDPFASGVLPLFLGAATRLVEYHLGDDKDYRATICFGATARKSVGKGK